jgi:NAD(P)-dependent dehydrogenase (short-subunit alcohol dehydrogenase family)
MGRLAGKVAIVTGAGSGIGAAGALLFAAEGARVVVVDSVAERVDATVAAVRAAGGDALGCTTDVSDFQAVGATVEATLAEYGRVDILWNNAGIVRGFGVPLEEISVETWHEVIDVNLNGTFYALKHVIPHMKARRSGAIVNTASIAGLVAYIPGRAPYSASKGAIVALTRLAALELAAFNIRVNCIAPGRVHTNIGADAPSRPAHNDFGIEWTPPVPHPETDATRAAEPIEIAHTALYLVSDEVGPLTGATISHDGGAASR